MNIGITENLQNKKGLSHDNFPKGSDSPTLGSCHGEKMTQQAKKTHMCVLMHIHTSVQKAQHKGMERKL